MKFSMHFVGGTSMEIEGSTWHIDAMNRTLEIALPDGITRYTFILSHLKYWKMELAAGVA